MRNQDKQPIIGQKEKNGMNSFVRHETRKSKFKDLYQKFGYENLLLLASILKIDPESFLRIMAGLQGIDPVLGERIDYLWQIHFPAPRRMLVPEIETIPESTAFSYEDQLVGKKDPYMDPIYWDILTEYVSEENYDGALARVRDRINPELEVHFGGHLSVYPAERISVGTLYGAEIPKNRVFELHIIDRETKEPRYALKYSKGEVQISIGNLPVYKIVAILKAEGFWE